MRIFGVILAGGESRRMGSDKAFVPLASRPLIAHVLNRLAPQVDAILISANRDPERFASFGCRVIPDAKPQGPLSGILAALIHAAEQGATHIVSCPVDTPFLPADLVPQLVRAAEHSPNGLAFAGDETGDHPATAVWPVALVPALAAFLGRGEAKVTRFTAAQQATRALFPDPQVFLNVNSPFDLAAAEALLKGAA
ncbi:MAG: molybdenum cofactor guanylyltransferase [Tabrizicola sp.]|nr:molybdenum cofactor guanylyltransferase [Tabrizicola sp.]